MFPGSTFKIVTAAAAIENGDYKQDDKVPAGSTWQAPGTRGEQNLIDNEGRAGCSPAEISFAAAMENSCNTAFAKMAVKVGPEKSAGDGRGLRLQQRLPARPRPAGPLGVPRGRRRHHRRQGPGPARDSTTRRRPARASASSRCRPRRCRWRWSSPRSPTAAR
ncbi:penicillin-binding transpeptidase domain-containing protein [Nocardioides convexus]|uniref:penicillin-binding transpeptidase domain-containing protein n=1 Tax=Nocardioides convexus TaxID=2712224 RepID=UPI003100FC67